MARNNCACEKYRDFNGEVAIHFPGIKGLQKPIVWTFPKLHICVECGCAHFSVPERELRVLVTGAPVDGAIVSTLREEIA